MGRNVALFTAGAAPTIEDAGTIGHRVETGYGLCTLRPSVRLKFLAPVIRSALVLSLFFYAPEAPSSRRQRHRFPSASVETSIRTTVTAGCATPP
jgi:hypothetical protein